MLDNDRGITYFPDGACPNCHHISLELISNEIATARIDAEGDAVEVERTVTEHVHCSRCEFESDVLIPFFGPLQIGSPIDGFIYPEYEENDTRAMFGRKEKTFNGNPMAY